MKFEIQKQNVAVGGGRYIPGIVVTKDGRFDRFFKHPGQARHYVERRLEELSRDG